VADRISRLGVQRGGWIRVVVRPGEAPYAELHEIGHRIPRVRRISVSVAARLASSGVPLVVNQQTSDQMAG
jgi:hypothetical protein